MAKKKAFFKNESVEQNESPILNESVEHNESPILNESVEHNESVKNFVSFLVKRKPIFNDNLLKNKRK